MKKIRHFVEYLAAFLVVLALLFAIASVIIVKFYGDEVKKVALEMINEQVDTKVQVEEVGISIFRKFPYTSVFFRDVVIWSGYGFNREEFPRESRDTLLQAKSVYLQFNLLDLARKKYDVHSLSVSGGIVRILTDSSGGNNYTLRSAERAASKGSSLLDLEGVRLDEIDLMIVNHAKHQEGRIELEDLDLSGNFSANHYQLSLSGDATLISWSESGIEYLSDQKIRSDVSFSVSDNLFTITRGKIDLGYILGDIRGKILLNAEQGAGLDLHMEATRVDLPWIAGIMVKQGNEQFKDIKIRGKADITADITGLVSPVRSPRIAASFSVKGSHLSGPFIPFPLEDISLSGKYDNGNLHTPSTTTLALEQVKFSALNSVVEGTLTIEDLLEPRYRAGINGRIDLTELHSIMDALPLKFTGGSLEPDLEIHGRIAGMGGPEREISFTPGGTVVLDGIGIGIPGTGLSFNDINGELLLDGNWWNTNFSALFMGSEFRITMRNNLPFAYLTGDGNLELSALVESQSLNLDRLSGSLEASKDTSSISWPERVKMDLEFRFGELTAMQTRAGNVSGRLQYRFPAITMSGFRMEAWNGRIDLEGSLTGPGGPGPRISLNTSMEDVDIEGPFLAFNNFNQEVLTSEHIRGKITASGEFTALMNDHWQLDRASIVSENHIRITDGALIDFKPLNELSAFLKIDGMERVSFSTIENDILIREGTITIPEMDISSDALNVKASGNQNLNGNYRYHLAVRLSEILFRKARASSDREFEVALDEDDRRTIFLLLYDEGKGMTIEFDEEQAMKKIRNDLKEEKQELKRLLNEEFGMFSKDEELIRDQKKEEPPVMKFEFGDEQDTLREERLQKKRRWWQRSSDKKQELDFVIEDDG